MKIVDNYNLKLMGYLSDIYNNLDTPKRARHYARLTAKELFTCEFPVAKSPKLTLTKSEIFEGQTHGKIACIKAFRTRTGFGLFDAKNFVEKYFADNGLTFG